MSDIQVMLTLSPTPNAEEWAIHDYDGFGSIRLDEYENITRVSEIADFIQEHGELGAELIAHWGDVDAARSSLEDHYAGEFQSAADFAQQSTEDTTDIPDNLQCYIDYDAMARDLEINDIFTIELGFEEVHVFWQN